MAILRLEALTALAKHIACEIPELPFEKICIGQQDPNHPLEFPHLTIKPIRWNFNPRQAEEVFVPTFDRVVMNVGNWECETQWILGTKTVFERFKLEEKLWQLLMVREGAPGVLVLPVTACPDLGRFVTSWELETDAWENEAAFDIQFYTTLDITGVIPVLITRQSAFTIEDLRLGISHDLAGEAATVFASPNTEVLRIDESGSLQPV